MKRILITAIALFLLISSLNAQNTTKLWTLEECILYAIDNNIGLKQRENDEALRKIELNASQISWLPTLSGYTNQNFGFGRSQSREGIWEDRNSANTSFGATTGMPIFNGFKVLNTIAARKLNLMAATESLNRAKEDLAIGVATYYLQALYSKELLNIAELQLELTLQKVKVTETLVEAGRVPMSQLYDIMAQLANDEVRLSVSKNDAGLALLDLAQALELERFGTDFDIVQPETNDAIAKYMGSILPPENIFYNAITFKPQIKEQEYLLQGQKKMLNIARADYFPSIRFSAGYSNGYYSTLVDANSQTLAFNNQIKMNAQKSLGFSLNIPVFSRFDVRNNVRQNHIRIANQELTIENSKKALYKEIQVAYFNATAAQEKLLASEKAVAASKEALFYAEEAYAAGRRTVFEYNESKTKYAQSLSEQAQAKYNFIFRVKILDFYNGIEIRL